MTGRRRVLRALVAAGATSTLAACLTADDGSIPRGEPTDRPRRQHAWNDRLHSDDDGNPVSPRHHVFCWFDYVGDDPDADRDRVERAFSDLERAFEASAAGLLFTVGYSSGYFDAYGDSAPVSPPERVASGGHVARDDADAFVHLVSDSARAVLEAEEALLGERESANGLSVTDVDGAFDRVRRRTGFAGEGEPAARDRLVGLPRTGRGEPAVPEAAPTFVGYRRGFRSNQATERQVTITDGRFAGGTTQVVEGFALQLSSWFSLDADERVAKLFGPELTARDVGETGENLTDHNGVIDQTDDDLVRAARSAGVVGHVQKLARHRDGGRPPILRRDVDSDDHGEAGVVFVSLQRSVADFERLRRAMAGHELADEAAIGEETNNGILEYVRPRHRGAFLLPPRERRALPL